MKSTGTATKIGFIRSMAMTPPIADARLPTRVTPIWTVARNRSGYSCRPWTRRAVRSPDFTRWRTLLFLREMSAISEAEKYPFTRIRRKMKKRSMNTIMV
jgi:hypothetical protein